MNLAEYERINPWAENAGIRFFTPNQHVLWRVKTLLTKEEDTINWLNKMPTNATLIDVGANIGQYSLYAARRGIQVYAIEPESQNFALLCRNIILNDAQDRVHAWPICISNKLELSTLYLSGMIAGGSCHAFDQPLNYNGEEKEWPAKQGSISVTLDQFIGQFLNDAHSIYLKIDVDGFEHNVIYGAVLSLSNITSILVEINSHYPEHNKLISYLEQQGFEYAPAQVAAARRTEGPFAGVGNYIFHRKIAK